MGFLKKYKTYRATPKNNHQLLLPALKALTKVRAF